MRRHLVFFCFLFVPLFSSGFSLPYPLEPEEWMEGFVKLANGEVVSGKLYLEYESVAKHVLVKDQRSGNKSRAEYGIYRGRRFQQEKLYLYHDGKVSAFKAEEVASFYFLNEENQVFAFYISLPFTFENEKPGFFFFQLLEEGPMSLFKRTVGMPPFGMAETYYFATEKNEVIPCPYSIKEVLAFMPENSATASKQSIWLRMMHTIYEDDLLNLFREYNDSLLTENSLELDVQHQ